MPAARRPIAGSGWVRTPSVGGLDDEQRRARALEVGGDDEELGVGGAGDERLEAVEDEAVAVAARRRPQLEGVEERRRGSSSASAAAGTFSPVNSGR